MEKLFAKIKKEILEPEEKAKILSALQDFVSQNPPQQIKSPFYNPWLVFVRRKTFMIPALTVLVIISLTSGTVLASKNSLPGEVLYPVKILDEQIRTITAIGPRAQAEVSASQAISRLQEVERMVTSNTPLSTTTKKEIQNKFGAQAQEVRRHVNELKGNGQTETAAKIQSNFESLIAEHRKAVIELSDTDGKRDEDSNGEVKGATTDDKNNGRTDLRQNTEIKQRTDRNSQNLRKPKTKND
jgi:hypothetical protein